MATATKIDYYELLSVQRTASDAEIKTAFRKAAMQYHPDRNPNNPAAEAKFSQMNVPGKTSEDQMKAVVFHGGGHQTPDGRQ